MDSHAPAVRSLERARPRSPKERPFRAHFSRRRSFPGLCRLHPAGSGRLHVVRHPGGLNRYDGYTFKVFSYDPEDPNSLSNNFVKTIYQDSRDDLGWHRRWRRQPLRPSDREFRVLPPRPDDPSSLSHDRVRAIVEDGMAAFGWAPTAAAQPLRSSNSRPSPTSPRSRRPRDAVSRPYPRLIADQTEPSGSAWTGAAQSLRPRSELFTHFRHAEDAPEPGGRPRPQPPGGPQGPDLDRHECRRARSPESRDRGAGSLPPRPRGHHSLASDTIWAIYQNSQGTMWVGTDGGLHEWHYRVGALHSLSERSDRPLQPQPQPGRLDLRGRWRGPVDRYLRGLEQVEHHQRSLPPLQAPERRARSTGGRLRHRHPRRVRRDLLDRHLRGWSESLRSRQPDIPAVRHDPKIPTA